MVVNIEGGGGGGGSLILFWWVLDSDQVCLGMDQAGLYPFALRNWIL